MTTVADLLLAATEQYDLDRRKDLLAFADRILEARHPELAVTYTEAGRLLGIKEFGIRQLVKEGRLPLVDIGERTKRIPMIALEAFANQPYLVLVSETSAGEPASPVDICATDTTVTSLVTPGGSERMGVPGHDEEVAG